MNFFITQKQEYEISAEERESLRSLLEASFPGYFSERIYHKQLSTLRLLAFSEGHLVGHVGVIHRVVSIEGNPIEILGVVGLCVSEAFPSKGIGTRLLTHVDELASTYQIHHILAFADDSRLYTALGYVPYPTTQCRFLAMDELRSHSVIEREEPSLHIKSFEKTDFADKTIDLLGHLF